MGFTENIIYHILYVSDSDSEDFDYDGDCDYVNDYDYEKDDSEDYDYSDDSDGYSREHIESSLYEGTIEELDDFCRKHKVKEAVDVLDILESKGVDVDFPRYVELIKLCRNYGVLEYAQFVHDHLIRLGKDNQDSLYNELLDMFLKCDSVSDAYEVFYNMPKDYSTVWDTMIMAFARNGYGEEAIKLFTRFLGAGFIPDGQIYLGVLFACSCLCDVDEGMLHFKSMRNVYGIVPSMKHYVIVVDMLGSAGCLDEAMEFIDKMPFEPSVDIWETLMNHCRIHGNNVLEDHCAEIINNIDKSKDGLVRVKDSDLAIEEERLSCQYIKVTEDDNELNTRDTSQSEIDDRI